jgi:hypothetical protein
MNLVMFAWFATTDIFNGITDIDMKNMLYKEQLKAIQDDLLPFGFISNPADDEPIIEVDNNGEQWVVQEHLSGL